MTTTRIEAPRPVVHVHRSESGDVFVVRPGARTDEVVIAVVGEIDLCSQAAFSAAARRALAGRAHTLIVDCSRAGFVDLAALAMLARVAAGGTDVALYRPSPTTRRVLALIAAPVRVTAEPPGHRAPTVVHASSPPRPKRAGAQ